MISANDDIQRALHRSSNNLDDSVQVVVSPLGMCGRLTGFCLTDLVDEVYFKSGQFKTSNRLVGLPLRQNCYVEVTLGLANKLNNDKNSHRRMGQNPMGTAL